MYLYTVKLGWSVYGYSIGKTNNSQIGKRLDVLYIHAHRYNIIHVHAPVLLVCYIMYA